MEEILRFETVSFAYEEGRKALSDVNVTVHAGERVAVLGNNSAGKSTFFLNINGVFTPEHGKIIYRDTVVNKKNLKELRKNIGIVFQDADNQIIASTVMAEVGFGPMNLKLSKQEVRQRVEEALEYIKEDEYVEVTPKAMRMRKVILDEIERKRANKN